MGVAGGLGGGGNRYRLSKVCKLPVRRWISPEDLRHSTVSTVNNIVLCT